MEGKVLVSCGAEIAFNSDSAKEKFLSTEFETISESSELKAKSLYFCGDKKFLEPLKAQLPDDLFVIFAKNFLEKNEDLLKDILPQISFWGQTENLPLAMSFLSKPFYDQVTEKDNDEVDGRQMGTCEIHPTAIISQNVFLGANVKIGKDARIYPGAVICSHSEIGEGSSIFPNVTVMPRTKIGKNCRIHSGTVIGSDGFGYNFDKGVHHKVWHFGGVEIGDHVEIGSNVSVDQGTFGPTKIGSGSKIDNQVQIAHNCILGQGVVLCGQAGMAGSSRVGNYSVFGGGARLAPDISVGEACQIGGMAGVISSVEDKAIVAGFPARPIKEWLKGIAYIRKESLKK